MKKEFLEAGKIVGTHGVRGELRIDPWADDGAFLSNFSTVYLNEGQNALNIIKIRQHGRIVIAAVEGVSTVEAAEKLRNKIIFIKRSDISLPEGRYFVDELIGCVAFDADTGERLGIISEVSKTGANDVWHIEKNGSQYLVPAIPEVIASVDIENERAVIRPLRGIFDED